ncbi:MAG: hypothetical protein ASARMPREDX12_001972 [Alectoria sarmentosa]|nr:MAG: hypothetical protein ASARMPREDX12_001972 [Alectoria sarmentosa]
MERLETTSQRGESTEAIEKSHTTSNTDRTFPAIFPSEILDMIFELVLGDHTIHIKSDVIPQKSDSEDVKHDDEDDDDDEDDEDEDDDNDGQDREEELEELSEILSDDRGPLYHSICDKELLHPKDARLYRIRSVEAKGNRDSRAQSNMVVKDFKNVRCPELSDPSLEPETIGSLGGEDEPPAQLSLAFLRVNKQVYLEASTILYSTRTFCFDDPTTFAQFFSINFNFSAHAPTSTTGTALLGTKRNSIQSVHIRARTALYYRQKVLWMVALDGATFVLPWLVEIRVLFDLCYEDKERQVDRTLWPYSRHRNGFPLLKTAEVRVATDVVPYPTEDDPERDELREVGWRVDLVEAIAGHHMDVMFGASLLDAAAVAARDAEFARP